MHTHVSASGRGRGQDTPISEPSASQREVFSVQENSACGSADASPNGRRWLGGRGGSGDLTHLYWASPAAEGPGTPLLSRGVAEYNWATGDPPGRRRRSGPSRPTGRRGWDCCLPEGDTGHGTVSEKRPLGWSWGEEWAAPGPEPLTGGRRGRWSGGRVWGSEAHARRGQSSWVTSSISGRQLGGHDSPRRP